LDRRAIWPDFRDAWVIHDDGALLVVDKPAGVPSQAALATQPDDIVTRLRSFLAERDGRTGETPYLGIHQRLDQATSGVIVFATRKEANARLAAQFEGRAVEKSYLACVTGWPRGRERVTLSDALAPDGGRHVRGSAAAWSRPEGKMRVAKPREPGAKKAVTQVKVLARRGERTMLELVLETGRTHQARVQLAHAGAPIAGDALYGGAPAPRLLLHASALGLEHPLTGKRMRFAAPAPAEFDEWMTRGDLGEAVYDDSAALQRALARALERRWGLGRSGTTTAFRLVNEEGDGLPRLAVDVYDAWLVAQLYDGTSPAPPERGQHQDDGGEWGSSASRRTRVLDALHALGFDGVYLKVRPRQANVLVDTRREDIAPAQPVRGQPAPAELTILEEGMPLLVRLADGLSTGLFLDQRANRGRVRSLAGGRSVGNLFAYTCAFTVAAAFGGALRTVSVDASVVALERGRENLRNAGVLDRGEHTFVAEDAFAWLARAAKRGDTFDLVILDPPSYSTTKRRRFVADSDYTELAASALHIVAPHGALLACTNHRGISRQRFRRILHDACRAAGRQAVQVKDLTELPDYPVPPRGEGHMKSALVRVA
jgi:23S rRNA (cytosine1962-C5)-methyltransferase